MKKIYAAVIFLFIIVTVLIIDHYVTASGEKYIIENKAVPAADAIIIPGASVYSNGRVSKILEERLMSAVEIYKKGFTNKIIVSGDARHNNEAIAMKNFLAAKGINPSIIIEDDYGVTSYDTVYRAKDEFKLRKVIICTQRYHLPRILYLANSLGLEACGFAPDSNNNTPGFYYRLREIIADTKAFMYINIFKPYPAFYEKKNM